MSSILKAPLKATASRRFSGSLFNKGETGVYGPTHYKFSTAIALGGVTLLDFFAGTGILWQATPEPIDLTHPFLWSTALGEMINGYWVDIPGYRFSLGTHFHLALLLGLLFVSFVSGLLPDVDCEHGTLGNLPRKFMNLDRHFMKSHIILLAISLFFLHIVDFILTAHFHLVRLLSGGHRHATHWIFTSFIWSLFLEVLFVLTNHRQWWPVAFAAWLAYLAHLASDAITRAGIPAFGPLDRNRYHLIPRPLTVRSGGAFDVFLGTISLVFAFILAVLPLWFALHRAL